METFDIGTGAGEYLLQCGLLAGRVGNGQDREAGGVKKLSPERHGAIV